MGLLKSPWEVRILNFSLGDRGQEAKLQYAILGLLVIVLILSGVAIWASMGEDVEDYATSSDIQSLEGSISDLNDGISGLQSSLEDLQTGQNQILESIGEEVARLSITSINAPQNVEVGENATVQVVVTNSGNASGSKDISLVVAGTTYGPENVTVDAGSTETVSFDISFEESGSVNVEADGSSTTVEVTEETQEEYTLGLAAHSVRNEWEDFYVKSFEWYCADHNIDYTWTEAGYDVAQQITQARRLIDQDIDGLIISPQGFEASREIMDYAEQNDVPVITTNADVKSDYPLMFVGYGQISGTEMLGQEMAEYLEEEVEPIGEVEGTVIQVMAEMGTTTQILRTEGFEQAMEEYPDVEVINIEAEGVRDQAKTKVVNTLQSRDNIDAIYTQNLAMGAGAASAVEDQGYEPGDIYINTVDAGPDTLDLIEEGWISLALDQPAQFYNPIAVHYMVEYLEHGEEAIPDVGTTITADDLTIEGENHLEMDPWAESVWAPGEIVSTDETMPDFYENYDHPWFRTNVAMVDNTNYDAPYLWGNAPLSGW